MVKKIGYYRRQADAALQDWGRRTYKECVICSSKMKLLHHFIPKSRCAALRFAPNNLVPLCSSCHLKFHSNMSPEMIGLLIRKWGIEWFNGLMLIKRVKIKSNKTYYEEIKKQYEY